MQKITRLMHVGQLPQKLRDQLDAEGGVIYLDEGIPVTAILQDFKAPGKDAAGGAGEDSLIANTTTQTFAPAAAEPRRMDYYFDVDQSAVKRHSLPGFGALHVSAPHSGRGRPS